ncbi:electron transport complex subunit E [Rhodoferax antarcticus]|uniref:Ion-translocating oxidoreductase complex subunit E n=1 Tax=Rhodoferax antarcticus ANT.BR TaxID=1111071 RepID=A0A1Q8YFT5_9BURK|nr:electron transport complex subunit E [Rhodoferax antarcticus]APW45432.1 electron transport complex subunit RsxE [Rhodoferax antarcticus]MCW2312710.1 electron transport complex protein RnfE [Rhodoferax antarcticus]OLP06863.1 electron transport complex protein rnfE [Rhodoferax antarcticus ANT.BR]
MSQTRNVMLDGVWRNNVVLTQMLSLCPALAVTSGATQGLGMGAATVVVLIASNILVALLRGLITEVVRIPAFVLIIATLVTIVDLVMNAWLHELHKVLGLFIPLIVVNCMILGRAESFASKNSVAMSAVDGLSMGLGFTLALTALGAIREVVGSGTLFAGASTLLGPALGILEMRIYPGQGALVMILPAGGFIALGLMIAAKRAMDARQAKLRMQATSTSAVRLGVAS